MLLDYANIKPCKHMTHLYGKKYVHYQLIRYQFVCIYTCWFKVELGDAPLEKYDFRWFLGTQTMVQVLTVGMLMLVFFVSEYPINELVKRKPFPLRGCHHHLDHFLGSSGV